MDMSVFEPEEISAKGLSTINYMFKIAQEV